MLKEVGVPKKSAAGEEGEQGQALRDGPRGPMPFSDRPLSSSQRSFRVGLTLERARRRRQDIHCVILGHHPTVATGKVHLGRR